MHYGKTRIVICADAAELGRAAAAAVGETLRTLLAAQNEVRIVFAAGESQMTFLDALARAEGIDWNRVVCISMDDFWEPRMPMEFTCARQARRQLYDKVKPKAFHIPAFDAPDAEAEAARFSALIRERPLDITCQGIGTSGHLAFNEPGATDFADPKFVRVMMIAEQSKRQLRDDPNFKALGYVPDKGISLTIPALLSAKHIFTIVPLGLKRPILTRLLALETPTVNLPATILRDTHGTLFVDRDSYPESLLSGVPA